MRYKEVGIEYKGKKIKAIVHIDGNETDEQLEQKAVELCDRVFDDRVLKHLGMEVFNSYK